MTQSNPRIPIAELRARVADRVERTSLRAVAAEIGMSPSGLSKFMAQGTEPYGKTIEKLLFWAATHLLETDASLEEMRRLGVSMATRGIAGEIGARTAAVMLDLLADPAETRLAAVEAALRETVPAEAEPDPARSGHWSRSGNLPRRRRKSRPSAPDERLLRHAQLPELTRGLTRERAPAREARLPIQLLVAGFIRRLEKRRRNA